MSGLSAVRDRLQQVVLFGSRARGDEKPYSDYDVLIVVKERDRDLVEAVHGAAIDALLATGRLVTPKIFRRRDFDRWSALPTPFFKNVLQEGVRIG